MSNLNIEKFNSKDTLRYGAMYIADRNAHWRYVNDNGNEEWVIPTQTYLADKKIYRGQFVMAGNTKVESAIDENHSDGFITPYDPNNFVDDSCLKSSDKTALLGIALNPTDDTRQDSKNLVHVQSTGVFVFDEAYTIVNNTNTTINELWPESLAALTMEDPIGKKVYLVGKPKNTEAHDSLVDYSFSLDPDDAEDSIAYSKLCIGRIARVCGSEANHNRQIWINLDIRYEEPARCIVQNVVLGEDIVVNKDPVCITVASTSEQNPIIKLTSAPIELTKENSGAYYAFTHNIEENSLEGNTLVYYKALKKYESIPNHGFIGVATKWKAEIIFFDNYWSYNDSIQILDDGYIKQSFIASMTNREDIEFLYSLNAIKKALGSWNVGNDKKEYTITVSKATNASFSSSFATLTNKFSDIINVDNNGNVSIVDGSSDVHIHYSKALNELGFYCAKTQSGFSEISNKGLLSDFRCKERADVTGVFFPSKPALLRAGTKIPIVTSGSVSLSYNDPNDTNYTNTFFLDSEHAQPNILENHESIFYSSVNGALISNTSNVFAPFIYKVLKRVSNKEVLVDIHREACNDMVSCVGTLAPCLDKNGEAVAFNNYLLCDGKTEHLIANYPSLYWYLVKMYGEAELKQGIEEKVEADYLASKNKTSTDSLTSEEQAELNGLKVAAKKSKFVIPYIEYNKTVMAQILAKPINALNDVEKHYFKKLLLETDSNGALIGNVEGQKVYRYDITDLVYKGMLHHPIGDNSVFDLTVECYYLDDTNKPEGTESKFVKIEDLLQKHDKEEERFKYTCSTFGNRYYIEFSGLPIVRLENDSSLPKTLTLKKITAYLYQRKYAGIEYYDFVEKLPLFTELEYGDMPDLVYDSNSWYDTYAERNNHGPSMHTVKILAEWLIDKSLELDHKLANVIAGRGADYDLLKDGNVVEQENGNPKTNDGKYIPSYNPFVNALSVQDIEPEHKQNQDGMSRLLATVQEREISSETYNLLEATAGFEIIDKLIHLFTTSEREKTIESTEHIVKILEEAVLRNDADVWSQTKKFESGTPTLNTHSVSTLSNLGSKYLFDLFVAKSGAGQILEDNEKDSNDGGEIQKYGKLIPFVINLNNGIIVGEYDDSLVHKSEFEAFYGYDLLDWKANPIFSKTYKKYQEEQDGRLDDLEGYLPSGETTILSTNATDKSLQEGDPGYVGVVRDYTPVNQSQADKYNEQYGYNEGDAGYKSTNLLVTQNMLADAVASILASAPAKFDTLKEIADWIASENESDKGAAKMWSDIQSLKTDLQTKLDASLGFIGYFEVDENGDLWLYYIDNQANNNPSQVEAYYQSLFTIEDNGDLYINVQMSN